MSVAIPSYLMMINKTRVMKARMDIQQISQVVEITALQNNGVYPATLASMLVGGDHAPMKFIPLDPWGHAYRYTNHVVYSYGADNLAGGTGYSTDISSDIQYVEL